MKSITTNMFSTLKSTCFWWRPAHAWFPIALSSQSVWRGRWTRVCLVPQLVHLALSRRTASSFCCDSTLGRQLVQVNKYLLWNSTRVVVPITYCVRYCLAYFRFGFEPVNGITDFYSPIWFSIWKLSRVRVCVSQPQSVARKIMTLIRNRSGAQKCTYDYMHTSRFFRFPSLIQFASMQS